MWVVLKGAPLWDSRIYWSLPRETREYVPRVLAAAWLFLHPERYGLELPSAPTEKVDLTLEREISLSELSVCLGQAGNPGGWFRTLRNLNPRLKPARRSKAGSRIEIPSVLARTYAERCVGDSGRSGYVTIIA